MELFYTADAPCQAYKNYVQMLAERVNTITGVKYADDPTILAWELCNECHTSDSYEIDRGMPPGGLLYGWLVSL